jgi:hypothetical protein
MSLSLAPPLLTSDWLNSAKPLGIPDFRGRILVIEAFQMLCPGCVSHGLPQVQRIAETFPSDQVAVIGLHCVFEHHRAQGTREALAAFVHEYRLTFPIGIDRQDGSLPATMAAYNMQGTPTLILVDRRGYRRFQRFGHVDDLYLGSIIGSLLAEPVQFTTQATPKTGCDDHGCPIPDES